MFRYRQLTENIGNPLTVGGDMTFGQGKRNFLVDSPTAVAQAVLTRLKLWQGEWWLNLMEGTAWMQEVLAQRISASNVPDSAIRARIQGTPYVTSMMDYVSTFEPSTRNFTVSCKLDTLFGPVTIAPQGALMSPTGAVVMPLTARTNTMLFPSSQQQLLPAR